VLLVTVMRPMIVIVVVALGVRVLVVMLVVVALGVPVLVVM